MRPLVDIILATYNGAAHLEAQLASLREQTYQNWRLIALDDGSTDTTCEILAHFAATEPRAQVVVAESATAGGSGPVAAFGAALTHSDAPYFMFCDQDDVWLPEKIDVLLGALQAGEDGGAPCLVHSDMQVVDEDLREIAPSFWGRANLKPERANAQSLLLRNVVTGCAMMGNAALRQAMVPIPNAAMMHDWWAALIAAHQGRVMAIPRATVAYRRHGSNVTTMNRPGALRRELSKAVMSGIDLAVYRAHLARLQAQARVLAPKVGACSLAAEFGHLPESGFLRRKTFLARHGLIRWNDPLWSFAYHWII